MEDYLSELREEGIYGVEYWLVSNERTNEIADNIERNGGDQYRPTEGTAYSTAKSQTSNTILARHKRKNSFSVQRLISTAI